jgi:hypothetical protein
MRTLGPLTVPARLGLWLVAAALLCGCAASGPFLHASQQVTGQFEAGAPPSELRYFFLASGQRPYVLLGVLPEFAPPGGDYWRPVGDDPARWLEMIRGMQFFDEQAIWPETYGARLMMPGGRQIGVWYSPRGRGTVALGADNRLLAWPPKPTRPLPVFRRD